MSRPIYEPNIQRTATRLNFGQEQLFRRPGPTSHVWGVPDLILSGGSATVTTDTEWPIPFPTLATPWTWDSGAGTIDDTDGELFTIAITDSGDAGNDRYEVTSRREGWWVNELITQWDQVSTAGTNDIASVRQRVYFTNTSGFGFDPVEWRDSYDWMIIGGAGGAIDSFGFQDNSYIRTWVGPHYIPFNKTWQSQAVQRTGSNRGLSGIKWAWWFIKADTLAGWTFDSV